MENFKVESDNAPSLNAILQCPLATGGGRIGKQIQYVDSSRFSQQSALKCSVQQKHEVSVKGVGFKFITGL